jgi:hypothetical protein
MALLLSPQARFYPWWEKCLTEYSWRCISETKEKSFPFHRGFVVRPINGTSTYIISTQIILSLHRKKFDFHTNYFHSQWHTKPHFVQHYFSQVSEEVYGGPLQILLLWACSLFQFTVSQKKKPILGRQKHSAHVELYHLQSFCHAYLKIVACGSLGVYHAGYFHTRPMILNQMGCQPASVKRIIY